MSAAERPARRSWRRVWALALALAGLHSRTGFTIAEFFPRQVMHLQQILHGFPLVSGTAEG